MVQRVKDMASLQMRLEFDPWPEELPHASGMARKKKKEKKNYFSFVLIKIQLSNISKSQVNFPTRSI